MSDEVLRLVARAKDEASGPLRKIRDALRGMKSGGEGPAEVKKAFKAWSGALKETREGIDKVHEASRRGLEPALDMLNLKTVAAAGGVATLVASLKSFADQGNELVGFSHKVRLSVDTIRGFDGVAEKFHVDPAELRQSEMTIVDSMDRVRKHRGEFYAYLKAQRPADAAALAATPNSEAGNEKALRITLRMLAQIKKEYGEGRARIFAKENLGSDAFVDMIRDGMPALDEAIAKYRQLAGAMDAKKGEDFTRAFSDFKASLEGLRNQAGADLLPEITAGVKELTEYVSAHKTEIEDGLVTVVKDIGEAARVAWPAVRDIAKASNDAATAMGGWGRVLEGYAAFKLAGYAFGFTRMAISVFGLAGAFRALGAARRGVPDLKTGEDTKPSKAQPAETKPGETPAEVKPRAATDNAGGKSLIEEAVEGASKLARAAEGAASLGTLAMLWQWAQQSDKGVDTLGHPIAPSDLAKNPLGIHLPGDPEQKPEPAKAAASFRTPAAYDREVRALPGDPEQKSEPAKAPASFRTPAAYDREVRALPGDPEQKSEPAKAPASFRTPAAYDREVRARAQRDDGTHALDGWVMGQLGKDVIHLNGTLKTLASKQDGGIVPAASEPAKAPASFRTPAAYDREVRARAQRDDGTHALDGWVMGQLGKDVIHLNGTLKTLASKQDGGIVPAAFRTGGGAAVGSESAAEDIMANGTYRGVLKALIDYANQSAADGDPGGAGSGGGFSLASFHPGGGLGSGGGGGGAGSGGGGSGSGGDGGHFDTSGGGSTSARGALAANQREAYAAALGEGLSKTAARALVADLSGEGLANDAHRVHWDGKHNSGGIAQWDPERAAAIQRQFGHLPWQMSVADQTRAAIWEYRNNPRFARTKAAMGGDDPGRMIGELVSNWEDPANKGRAISQRMGYYRGFSPDAPSSPIGQLKLASKVAGIQCVALANAAVGFSGSVKDWRKGIGAAEGSLVDGTPVATFLNPDGSQSDRYAGGGIGTEGAHRDHAGIFRRYLKDAAGKIVGMTLAEQYRTSHGVHNRDYLFGRGSGEGDGSNYHAIMGPDGKPLGGGRNPMSQRPGELTKKSQQAQAMIHRVHGTGELAVRVDAPRGTKVAASGGGLFSKVSLNRGYAMTPASETG